VYPSTQIAADLVARRAASGSLLTLERA
jgi:hypothetical protein